MDRLKKAMFKYEQELWDKGSIYNGDVLKAMRKATKEKDRLMSTMTMEDFQGTVRKIQQEITAWRLSKTDEWEAKKPKPPRKVSKKKQRRKTRQFCRQFERR